MSVGPFDLLSHAADRFADARAMLAGGIARDADVRAWHPPQPSTDPLSVAAPRDTWFITQDARGERHYGRDGSLRITEDGSVRIGDEAALGTLDGGEPGVLSAMRLPEPDHSLGRCIDVRIDADGTLAYRRIAVDPRSQERSSERVVVGRLALARFPAGTAPIVLDATHVVPPQHVTPLVGYPSDGSFAALATSARDGGGVDVDAAIARLSDDYLALHALSAAQRASDSTDRTALDLVK
jgi:hypothetical protein